MKLLSRSALAGVWSRVSLSLLLSLPLAATAAAEPIQVMASIKPLALMVEEIAGERAEVSVLVRPGQTPHDFAFKVSDRQRLSQADLLVWVGPSLEPYLAALAADGEQLSMASVLEVKAAQNLSHDDDHGHHQSHNGGHSHHHGHGQADQHFWLNPVYGKAMVIAIAETLARLDPQHGARYRQNAERIGQQLLTIALAPRAEHDSPTSPVRQYAVVHQAFDYFLEHFPYPQPMVLTPIPEVSPGARQLWQASQRLQPGDCLMVESRSPGKWVQTFSESRGLQIRLVDIMGYEEKVKTYTELLEGVKSVFDDCAQ